MKKIYVIPSVKVRYITNTTILAGSSVPVSSDASGSYQGDGGGSGDAKGVSFLEFGSN